MKIRKLKFSHNLAYIFSSSSLLFILGTIFGAYERPIADLFWFIVFYVFQFLFFLGLLTGNVVISKNKKRNQRCFFISKTGRKIILILNVIAILSFLYFLFLYVKIVGLGLLGQYTADIFNLQRGSLEKLTLLLMQIGGETCYLLIYCDENLRNGWRFKIATICMFLPGIRSLMLGNRFTVAVEFMLFTITNWPKVKNAASRIRNTRKKKYLIFFVGILLLFAFMYLFATRSVYTATEKSEFEAGDMILKPIWRYLYQLSNGMVDPIITLSDYISEAPYVFSYVCKNKMPEKVLYGTITFRPVWQIVNMLAGSGGNYAESISSIAVGKYTGFGYELIGDFGVLAPLMAIVFGVVYAKIEYYSTKYKSCAALYPLTKVICFFAPVFFFNVGRCDYPFMFTLILAPFILHSRVI